MSLRADTLQLMQQLGIEPKKSLGQNFLISEHVVAKIINALQVEKLTHIIEIGPGLGSLTRPLRLLQIPLQLIELDHTFAEYWKQQGCAVEEQDALAYNWAALPQVETTALISNLPYQISSRIVIDRCLDEKQFALLLFMFQKEVAQRLKAQQGQELYGMLSVVAQTFWDIDLLLEAGSGDFMPPPQVASRVLIFKPKTRPQAWTIQNKKQYFQFVKACFLHPRKMMISNLLSALGRPRESLLANFQKIQINEKTRAEELNIEQFIQLYHELGYTKP